MNIVVEHASLVINGAMNTIALKWKEYTFFGAGREGGGISIPISSKSSFGMVLWI
jgi:hypothetical protein